MFEKAKCPSCKAKLNVKKTIKPKEFIGECSDILCGEVWLLIVPSEEGTWYALPLKKLGKFDKNFYPKN